MKIYILGICGTFMGSVALLAKQKGLEVSGADAAAYPPISTQLQDAGITFNDHYDPMHLMDFAPDYVVVGNVVRRGWPIIEFLLKRRQPLLSGAAWVSRYVLQGQHVLAVSGTHGKTTTASMLAWILSEAGLSPGFLIGGVPKNFGMSARLGGGRYFVIEADEYDTAFFDKRSKFVHYWPNTLVINNLEFDHADIFKDLTDIQTQFHHLVRTVPSDGLIAYPDQSDTISTVLSKGCWTPTVLTGVVDQKADAREGWFAFHVSPEGGQFNVLYNKEVVGQVSWNMIGRHHVDNALVALAAAHHVGVAPAGAIAALNRFDGVARRLEVCARAGSVTLYDDFAHHPTAIRSVLESLRAHVGQSGRLIVLIEFNSYTMRTGQHAISLLGCALDTATYVYCLNPNLRPDESGWNVSLLSEKLDGRMSFFDDVAKLAASVIENTQSGDHIVMMSNGHFGGIRQYLSRALKKRYKL